MKPFSRPKSSDWEAGKRTKPASESVNPSQKLYTQKHAFSTLGTKKFIFFHFFSSGVFLAVFCVGS
jgi:hypothetical protein